MSSNPLDAYKEFDPKLIEQYEKLQGLTYTEGALIGLLLFFQR
jgi:hypothetical protein